MQQAAYERVKRMQEHTRKLCAPDRKPEAKPQPIRSEHQSNEQWLLLLVLLILFQNGGNKSLLILLAYLMMSP